MIPAKRVTGDNIICNTWANKTSRVGQSMIDPQDLAGRSLVVGLNAIEVNARCGGIALLRPAVPTGDMLAALSPAVPEFLYQGSAGVEDTDHDPAISRQLVADGDGTAGGSCVRSVLLFAW